MSFLDLKASDLVGAYIQDREITKQERLAEAARTTAEPAVVEQRSDPNGDGGEATAKRSSNRDIWKWVGIGSAALLVGAVAVKMVAK